MLLIAKSATVNTPSANYRRTRQEKLGKSYNIMTEENLNRLLIYASFFINYISGPCEGEVKECPSPAIPDEQGDVKGEGDTCNFCR